MMKHQIVEHTRSTVSRRYALIGTGSLAITIGFTPPTLSAQLPRYSADRFLPYIGQGFLVTGNNLNVALHLVKVEKYQRGNRPASLPDPFSLIFRSVSGTAPIPAEMVHIEHAGLGSITVYLNPITKKGGFYEVAFN
jgi:hypothetical protein